MVVIFLEEPLVFLSDVFQEVLTIGGSCIPINDEEVLVWYAWDVTTNDCKCSMALILVYQSPHGLGLLLGSFLAFALLSSTGDLNWYFISLFNLRNVNQDETMLIGVLLELLWLFLGCSIFLFNGDLISMILVDHLIGYWEKLNFMLDLFEFGIVIFDWEPI